MIVQNFSNNFFLSALWQVPKNYVIKTLFFQWPSKLFDSSKIEDSIWTWNKNALI